MFRGALHLVAAVGFDIIPRHARIPKRLVVSTNNHGAGIDDCRIKGSNRHNKITICLVFLSSWARHKSNSDVWSTVSV